MENTRVLVVDDDWLNIEVLEAYLETENYIVHAVHSGEQALTFVAATPPDVILLDVRMTGMSGYETCAALKADEKTRHIPVLIITAFQEKADVQKAISAGTDDMLFKPIRPELLLLRVRNMARMKQLHDQLNV